jgi:hypothetical protein
VSERRDRKRLGQALQEAEQGGLEVADQLSRADWRRPFAAGPLFIHA